MSSVSLLGLGNMGCALAIALLPSHEEVTVWNRTRGKARDLVAAGAVEANTIGDAVRASGTIVVCLLDHASIHEALDPVIEHLRGRTLLNVTTTSPAEARELDRWASAAGLEYLDGGILAVPSMIGSPRSEILYSGDSQAFIRLQPVLARWGRSTFVGTDAGLASLYDLALLAGMYVMHAGYMQGAALVATAGVSATDFADRAANWLTDMTGAFARFGRVIDSAEYALPGQQSLDFSDLSKLVEATAEAGVGNEPIAMVQRLIDAQRALGHGSDGLARIYESLAAPAHHAARRSPIRSADQHNA